MKNGVHHTITPPWADFPWCRYLNSWNGVGAKKGGVGNITRRAFRRCIVRCWHWHPLGCQAIELGKPPEWCVCDIHRRIPYSINHMKAARVRLGNDNVVLGLQCKGLYEPRVAWTIVYVKAAPTARASRHEQHQPERKCWAGSLLTHCNTLRYYSVKTTAVPTTDYHKGNEFVAYINYQIFVDHSKTYTPCSTCDRNITRLMLAKMSYEKTIDFHIWGVFIFFSRIRIARS